MFATHQYILEGTAMPCPYNLSHSFFKLVDYGQAVLELKAAAEQDPEIAQAVVDMEAAVNNNQSENTQEIKSKAVEIESHPSVVNNGEIKNLFFNPAFHGPVTFN